MYGIYVPTPLDDEAMSTVDDTIDLDNHMLQQKCKGVIVHNNYQVLFRTLNVESCSKLHQFCADSLSLQPHQNQLVTEGARKVASANSSQEQLNQSTPSLSCANFGSSTLP